MVFLQTCAYGSAVSLEGSFNPLLQQWVAKPYAQADVVSERRRSVLDRAERLDLQSTRRQGGEVSGHGAPGDRHIDFVARYRVKYTKSNRRTTSPGRMGILPVLFQKNLETIKRPLKQSPGKNHLHSDPFGLPVDEKKNA